MARSARELARPRPPIEDTGEVADPDELAPPLDPSAIERRYRVERARRRARERHKQEKGLARVRFYAALVILVAGAISLLVLTWDQVQRLFGL